MELVRVLSSADVEGVFIHFQNLSERDLRYRFFYLPSQKSIREYVVKSFAQGWVLGYFDPDLIGVIHLETTLDKKCLEVALSVLQGQRKKGVGRALLNRAVDLAKENGYQLLRFDSDLENESMTAFMRKLGATIASREDSTLKWSILLS